MKKLIGVLAVLCVLGLAANAAAAPNSERRVDYKKVDKNGDGKLTYEEIKAMYPNYNEELQSFNDVDGDGVLSPWEWYRAVLWPDSLVEIKRLQPTARQQMIELNRGTAETADDAMGTAPASSDSAAPGANNTQE